MIIIFSFHPGQKQRVPVPAATSATALQKKTRCPVYIMIICALRTALLYPYNLNYFW
jgi:hypothetical protein